MKSVFSVVGLTLLLASSAMAQGTVRQVDVNGGSGNAQYPVAVLGSNGVSYDCKADLFSDAGLQKRLCVPNAITNQATPVLLTGGLGVGVGVGVVALTLAVVAITVGSDDTSTTTTSTAGTP